jgi:hypothetical protein
MAKPDETGGAEGPRTPDLDIANVALSQLSYGPVVPETRAADAVAEVEELWDSADFLSSRAAATRHVSSLEQSLPSHRIML